MATYNVASGAVGTAANTMTASTVDTVTFADNISSVEVVSPATNTADVWYTLDGSTPTVGGAACYYLPAGSVDRRDVPGGGQGEKADTVKLISSGTPTIRVQKGA